MDIANLAASLGLTGLLQDVDWSRLHHYLAPPTLDFTFWRTLAGIIWVDLLLSGDNAVVVAAVAQRLPAGRKRNTAIVGGTLAAVVLRIVFAAVISIISSVQGLGVLGAGMLLYVAVGMVVESEGGGKDRVAGSVLGAVAMIVVADASMSLDNVLAVAGLARDSVWLLVAGLLVSIVLVVVGASVFSSVLERYPLTKWLGGGLLGWVAGGVAASDPAVELLLHADHDALHYVLSGLCVTFVLVYGRGVAQARSRERRHIDRRDGPPAAPVLVAPPLAPRSGGGAAARAS